MGIFANIVYFFPSRKLKVIGVTGTDGKTTTVNLIYHILKHSGQKVSMISSIGADIGGKTYNTGFHVTTPGTFSIQKYLRKAAQKRNEYFVLEVTSHALDQYRVWGINFEVGVITNITNEHLDYHKTYDNYVKTKVKLLNKSKTCIVNSDDSSYTLLSEAKSKKKLSSWITYGLSDSSDYNPKTYDISASKLIGDFNKYNVLAAVAASKALGIDEKLINNALMTFKLPSGREELVYDEDFRVMIDFAHTPNAFENILKAIKPVVKGKLIHVFGSAGERDRVKRPFLGEISSKYSDIVVLTAEDPRSEKVDDIIAEIETGIKHKDAQVIRIPDRKEAIMAAIEMAKKDDFVLITGKAQEASMNYGKGETVWSEFEVVKDALKIRNKNEK